MPRRQRSLQTLPFHPQHSQQRIAQLETENQRLLEEKRVRELESQNAQLRQGAETNPEELEGFSDGAATSGPRTGKNDTP